MLSEEEGLHTLALRDRYQFIPLPMISPYDDPPENYSPPPEASCMSENGPALKRNRVGLWRRDLVPLPSVLENMEEVSRFFDNKVESNQMSPYPVVHFDDVARELYQFIDNNNWRAARMR